MQSSSSLGMHTLDQSLSELVAAGLVSRQVAEGYLVDPRALDKVRVRPQDLDADAWAQHAAVQQPARRAG
jgi:Tfp pilus assembly ATPase PilU